MSRKTERSEADFLQRLEAFETRLGDERDPIPDRPTLASPALAPLFEWLSPEQIETTVGSALHHRKPSRPLRTPLDLVGTRVGNVRVDQLIGAGGMGEVYRGFDLVLARPVALKSIRAGLEENRERMIREARFLSRLDHPGICRIYDVEEIDDRILLVLELIEGVTLSAALAGGPLEAERRMSLALSVAEAVDAAHAEGVVHRDLKPTNVMVDAGRARVLDFGIARHLEDSVLEPLETATEPGADGEPEDTLPLGPDTPTATPLTRPGVLLGTPAYMSPEQVKGETAGAPSDIYALGLILYEMWTGSALFGKKSFAELLSLKLRPRVPELDACPAPLRTLLRGMLQHDPEDRPTASEVVAALREIRDRPARARRRLGIATLTGLFGLLVVVAVWSWLRGSQERSVWADLRSPPRLLVLPFDNATGDPALGWVRLGLRAMVTESLTAGSDLSLVRLEATQDIQDTREPGEAGLSELARRAGVDLVLDARILEIEDGFRLEARLATPSGRIVRRRVEASQLTTAAAGLVDNLLRRLKPDRVVTEVHTGDPFVDRLYAMAADAVIRGDDPTGSRALLERCLDLEPTFHRGRMQLVLARLQASEFAEAEATLDVLRSSDTLDERPEIAPELAELELGLASRTGDLDRARRVGREALAHIESGDWDDSWSATFFDEMGEVELRAENAERALGWLRQAEARQRSEMRSPELARIMLRIGAALDRLHRDEEAFAALDEAEALARDLRSKRLIGQIENVRGGIHRRVGNLDAALEAFERAEENARATQNVELAQAILTNRATILVDNGRLDEGYELMLRSLEETRELGQKHNIALVEFNLTYVALRREDPEAARKHLETARAFYGDDWDVLFLQAEIELQEGRPQKAVATLESAKEKAGDLWSANEEETLRQAREVAAGRREDGRPSEL